MDNLPKQERVPLLKENFVVTWGWRSHPYTSQAKPKITWQMMAILGVWTCFIALLSTWTLNTGMTELLETLGDPAPMMPPVAHVLLLVACITGMVGMSMYMIYRMTHLDRQDQFSHLMNFLFTRDRALLIIPTSSRKASQLWAIGYMLYLAFLIASPIVSLGVVIGNM